MIRRIVGSDREEYLKMADDFYHSDAVSHAIPRANFEDAFKEAIGNNPFIELYILEHEGIIAGYAAIAVTYTTEGGGKTLWLDELYVKEQFRGKGLGRSVIEYLKSDDTVKRIRLEITPSNSDAERLYKALGFCVCDYKQLIWDRNRGE